MLYALIYGFSSLIFYALEDIMNLGYMQNKFFNKTATNVYSILMIFSLTVLVLLMIKNFRR